MPFSVSLEHFRIFDNTGQVPIRPITLLTGGNSAGKSSFLAALRYMSDIDYFGSPAQSFNKEPFFLGSFDQIAHYRGGKYGRSKNFSISYNGPTLRGIPSARRASTQNVSFEIKFSKRLSQPTIQEVRYKSDETEIGLIFSNDWKELRVSGQFQGIDISDNIDTFSQIGSDVFSISPSSLAFLIDSLTIRRRTTQKPEEASRAYHLSQDFRAGISAVPPASYVGAPVRSRPSRTYDPIDTSPQPEGSHVPSQMAQLARTSPNEWFQIRNRLVDFGRASSLFTDLEVRSLGRGDSDPFQIDISINGPKRNIMDVGYGVSQAIPVVYEMLRRPSNTLYIAQQPEVHLHPEAQSALGTLISSEIRRIPGYFVIETHSDFLINRIRRHIREGKISKEEVSLLYFSKSLFSADIIEIKLDDTGQIEDAPDSYRDFFFKEEIENLGF